MRALITQLLRFGVVGGFGFVIDVGVFNLLRITVFSPEVVNEGPVLAKIVSTSLAIAVNWVGNRYWTFGAQRRPQALREGMEFALVSVGGMMIGLACLWISHYVLGYTSLLADNISTNVIGLALGTTFRFWLYRTWVFAPGRSVSSAPAQAIPLSSPAARASWSAEGTVLPSGVSPLHRIQAIPTVDDRAIAND